MSSEQAPNPRDAIRGTTRVIAKAIATADGVPERFVQDEAFDNAVEAVVRAVEALRVGWERDARQAERDRIRGDLDSMTRRVPSSMGGAGMPLAAPRAPDWECYYNVYDVREKLLDGEQR